MAAATLFPAVLSLADDLSQSVVFFTAARSRSLDVPVRVARMANGRLRSLRRSGQSSTVGVTAVSVTPAVEWTLEGWAGRNVLYRDRWGRKVYGVLQVTGFVDFVDVERRDVSLTVTEITKSEAV